MEKSLPYELFIEISRFALHSKYSLFLSLSCHKFNSLIKIKLSYKPSIYQYRKKQSFIINLNELNYNLFKYCIKIYEKTLSVNMDLYGLYSIYINLFRPNHFYDLFVNSIRTNNLKKMKLIFKMNYKLIDYSINFTGMELTFSTVKWLYENFFIDFSKDRDSDLFRILSSSEGYLDADYKLIKKIINYSIENNINLDYNKFLEIADEKKFFKDLKLELCYFNKKFLNNVNNVEILKSYCEHLIFNDTIKYSCIYLNSFYQLDQYIIPVLNKEIHICEIYKNLSKYDEANERIYRKGVYSVDTYKVVKLIIKKKLYTRFLTYFPQIKNCYEYLWFKYFAKSVWRDEKYNNFCKKYRYEKYTLFDTVEIYKIKLNN